MVDTPSAGFTVRVTGAGIDFTLAVRSLADLELVEALMAEIRERLPAPSPKDLPLHIVLMRGTTTGAVACRRGLPDASFCWESVLRTADPPPAYLLTWETAAGARKFAEMNGGTVTTVAEYFLASAQTTGT